jgi:hypothetical protein
MDSKAEPIRRFNPIFLADRVQFTLDPTGGLCVYKDPEPGHSYTVGADCASGSANEPGQRDTTHSKCGFVVTDTTFYPKVEVAAVFSASQLDPGWLALLATEVAKLYHQAMVCPETNGPGVAMLTAFLGSGHKKPMYTKLYRQKRSGPDENGDYYRLGWNNNATTRPLMEKFIADALRTTPIRDSRLIDQLQTFVWTITGQTIRGKAAPGCHDDLVISLGLSIAAGEQWRGLRTGEPAVELSFDTLVSEAREGKMTMEEVVYKVVDASRRKAREK